jgi:hypothetical protein
MKCFEDLDFTFVKLTFDDVDFPTFDAVEFDAAILSLSKGSKIAFLFFDSNQSFWTGRQMCQRLFFDGLQVAQFVILSWLTQT